MVENDIDPVSRAVLSPLEKRAADLGINVQYLVERTIGISHARNSGVKAASASYVAFIDDDEYARPDWLQYLYATASKNGADVVCGPVEPVFEAECPRWVTQSRIFDRPSYPTGQCSGPRGGTGNMLVSLEALELRPEPFDPAYALTGGSDSELLGWLHKRGASIYWCQEAKVVEWQGLERCCLRWHVRRGYRGGWGFARQSVGLKGPLHGSIRVLGPLPLGFAKAFVAAVKHMPNTRAVCFVLMRNLATQVGKLGYFFGLSIKTYG